MQPLKTMISPWSHTYWSVQLKLKLVALYKTTDAQNEPDIWCQQKSWAWSNWPDTSQRSACVWEKKDCVYKEAMYLGHINDEWFNRIHIQYHHCLHSTKWNRSMRQSWDNFSYLAIKTLWNSKIKTVFGTVQKCLLVQVTLCSGHEWKYNSSLVISGINWGMFLILGELICKTSVNPKGEIWNTIH